jgi:hypothetical protein
MPPFGGTDLTDHLLSSSASGVNIQSIWAQAGGRVGTLGER